ncbi:radical SAM protein [Polyangium spumosum]|uniref:radical SAM protein n=1 Tax=Polyangium spumosum TaxID=889282 RepID=UPI0014795270|nr:radical SAM protein [Polyangium spumosum]
MANIGYIQVVRHCNHFCGFCSNPTTPYVHTFDTMKVLVDDLVKRGYFGVILTGGEPTLHPELPKIAAYASSQGLHVRMITNGSRLSDPAFAREVAEAGVRLVHVSVYSVRPEVEAILRGAEGTLEKAFAAVKNAHDHGIEVNINCVINKLNADHLDENIDHWIERHPYVRHFVWNNLDPSMGRAEVNQAQFTPRLAEFEVSLQRALRKLHASGRTFRVEKVPLCYMTEFAWASTETRKIVKGEERIVHFLDNKQTVRQTDWEHIYAPACAHCTLRPICGGLFDRGAAYDPEELSPVFVSMDAVVETIITDPSDPSYPLRTLPAWKKDFDRRLAEARDHSFEKPHASAEEMRPPDAPPVGMVTEKGLRLFEAKRKSEAKKAESLGVSMERVDAAVPEDGANGI